MKFRSVASFLLLLSLSFLVSSNALAAGGGSAVKAETAVKNAEAIGNKIKPNVTASTVKSLNKLDSKLLSSFALGIKNAKTEVNKLPVNTKKNYQKRLLAIDTLYNTAKTYSTVYGYGEALSSAQLTFTNAVTKSPESPQTLQDYNDLSKKLSTFSTGASKITGANTRSAFLSKFKQPADAIILKHKPTMAANVEYTKLKKAVTAKVKESDFLKQEDTTLKAIEKIADSKIKSRFLSLHQSLYYQYYPERKSIDAYMTGLNSTVTGKKLTQLTANFDVDAASKTVLNDFFKTLFNNKQIKVKKVSYSYITSTKIKWVISYGNGKTINMTLSLSAQTKARKITDVELPMNMAQYKGQSISASDQKQIQALFSKLVNAYNQGDYDQYVGQLSLVNPTKHEMDLLNLYNDLANHSLSQRMKSLTLFAVDNAGIITCYSTSIYGEDQGFVGLIESTQWKLKKINGSWKIIDYTVLGQGNPGDFGIVDIK